MTKERIKRAGLEPTPLLDYIYLAHQTKGFQFFAVWGTNGFGKSTLGLTVLYHFYKDWEVVFNHLIFTPDQLITKIITEHEDDLLHRTPLLLWDDAGTYADKWTSMHAPEMMEFYGLFAAIRPRLSVLLATMLQPDDLPPGLRNRYTGEVHCMRRGYFEFQKYRWYPDFDHPGHIKKRMTLMEEGTFPALPDDIYERYELLRNRHLLTLKAEKLAMTTEERILERMHKRERDLLGMMYQKMEVDRSQFYRKWSPQRPTLRRLQVLGLVERDGDTVRITPRGEEIYQIISETD